MTNKTILVSLLAGLLGANAYAQSPLGDLSISGAVSYESQYVFRGKKITNSAIQPKIEAGDQLLGGNLYVGAWSNQPASRRNNTAGPNQADEIDLYGGFLYTLPGGVSLDLGNTYYWYPEAGGSSIPGPFGAHPSRTDETYLGVSLDSSSLLAGVNLSPSAYFYHDWFLDSNVVEVSAKYVWDISNMIGVAGVSLVPRVYGGWDEAHRSWGDQVNTGIPGNPSPNWRNSYFYYGCNIDLDYKVSDFCVIYISGSYAGNTDGKGPAPFGNATGETAQNGGSPNSAWFGAGVKFAR